MQTLKITEGASSKTIRKKPTLAILITQMLSWFALIAFLIIFLTKIKFGGKIFIAIYVLALIGNLYYCLSLFLGKIIIDTEKKVLTIFNPFKHTCSFDEIFSIDEGCKSFNKGSSRLGVTISLKNGSSIVMQTGSELQAKELKETLLDSIHLSEENEETENEL